MMFQKSAWRYKLDLARKKSSKDHHLIKFGRPSPWCYIQRFSLKAFLVLERKKVFFLPYMGMMAILYNDGTIEQIDKSSSTEGPMWNWWKLGK